MDGGANSRSLFSDRLQEAPQPSPLPLPLPLPQEPQQPPPPPPPAPAAIQERVKSPEANSTVTHINAATDALKQPHTAAAVAPAAAPEGGKSLLLQGLEGTMALLAAKGVEGTQSIYPIALENLRAFLPYKSSDAAKSTPPSYLPEQQRINTVESHSNSTERSREREGVHRPECGEAAAAAGGEASRHGHNRTSSNPSTPKSQLSNPRHDATLVHAIRSVTR